VTSIAERASSERAATDGSARVRTRALARTRPEFMTDEQLCAERGRIEGKARVLLEALAIDLVPSLRRRRAPHTFRVGRRARAPARPRAGGQLAPRRAARLTADQEAARSGTASPVTRARKNKSANSPFTPTPHASRDERSDVAMILHTATRTSTHSACVTLARAQPASREARATPAGEQDGMRRRSNPTPLCPPTPTRTRPASRVARRACQDAAHAQGTRRPQPEGRGRRSHPDAPQTGEHQSKDQLEPVAEIDAAGVVTHFIYASRSHLPDLMVKSGVAYRLLVDQLGSVRMVVRVSDGAVMQQIDYDPWGVPTLVSGDWDVQPFGFAGGLYDSETGLVRFGARDYDAVAGRWTAKDPIRFDDGSNVYLYSRGDPVNLDDRSGKSVAYCETKRMWGLAGALVCAAACFDLMGSSVAAGLACMSACTGLVAYTQDQFDQCLQDMCTKPGAELAQCNKYCDKPGSKYSWCWDSNWAPECPWKSE
jgi:RHS repeat-associated protein